MKKLFKIDSVYEPTKILTGLSCGELNPHQFYRFITLNGSIHSEFHRAFFDGILKREIDFYLFGNYKILENSDRETN